MRNIASIIKGVKFAMPTTVTPEGQPHTRPLTSRQTEGDGDLWFIVGEDSEAGRDIRGNAQVHG